MQKNKEQGKSEEEPTPAEQEYETVWITKMISNAMSWEEMNDPNNRIAVQMPKSAKKNSQEDS